MIKKALFLFMLLCSFSAYAEDMSIYDTEVSIDAVSANAALAREKAMAQANRNALYAVINRISTASSTNILDKLNDNQILNFIKEVTVITEKVSGNRYVADLKITINADILKTYLREKDAPVAALEDSQIVIIPVYRVQAGTPALLWEPENDWMQTWKDNQISSGQIKVSAINDSDENKELSAEQALRLDGVSLDAVARRCGSNDIFVAEASRDGAILNLRLLSFKKGAILSKQYPNDETAFDNAVTDIKAAVFSELQKQTFSKENAQTEINVMYTYPALKDWISLQQNLGKIGQIKQVTTEAMGSRKAQFKLLFGGSIEGLAAAFAEQGFSLRNSNGFYILERL